MFIGNDLANNSNANALVEKPKLRAKVIKNTSLALIIAISYMQIEAVVSVILANVMFINDLHNKREQRDIDDQV